ncbi:hypothetical protein [Halosimplex carlsbadense]|uniref:hypothetical protein n=1 Tax=Halosimplex carlsbadense TaxID=171164 RepID=UPI000677F100|nr:hypothetical protein [Halosimplex carlsbadense]
MSVGTSDATCSNRSAGSVPVPQYYSVGITTVRMAGDSRSGTLQTGSYVVAAAVLGAVVGYLREGSVGGALALSFAVGLGVALAVLGLAAWNRYF